MNIHPIVVHFPIALLVLYGVFELVPFKKIKEYASWFYIKAILVIAGVFTAQIALGTGGAVQRMFRDIPEKNAIVPVHALWAGTSALIFLILAFAYAILWIEYDTPASFFETRPQLKKLQVFLTIPATFILHTPTSSMLAFSGILSVTITGALGGAMVHGIKVDPLVSFVYRLFF